MHSFFQKQVYKNKTLVILLLLAIGIKLFSLNSFRVERYYTYGIYPGLSKLLRILFGWIPLSMGDVLYFFAFLYICYGVVQSYQYFKRNGFAAHSIWRFAKKILTVLLSVYIVFYSLWGLNYERVGVAGQLNLKAAPYSQKDITLLLTILTQRLNYYAAQVDTLSRENLNANTGLVKGGYNAYEYAAKKYSYLSYRFVSIKPSLYSFIGHLFGFTGYYNPFTAEAQIKTSIPVFLKPFVISHEMAHQLGYAKESEANFVAYLSCNASQDINFKYSAYFELFLYAANEIKDTSHQARKELISKANLHPLVLKDYQSLVDYLVKSQNVIEPFIARFYDQYLKLNNQPKGERSYNEVIAWLIAYQKKYGAAAI